MGNVLVLILRAVARAPVEFLRHLLLLAYLLCRLIVGVIRFVCAGKWRDPPPPQKCPDDVPPMVKRKPDPCLYSQSFLQAQGVAVTWDNPDIWLTEIDGTPVSSGELVADHDYVVHVRIWNAAFYPAFAVEVRAAYRDLGFSGPWLVMEVRPDGTEQVKLLDIGPWGNSETSFRWHTPGSGGHFCIRMTCSHPDDKNALNNVGQENTNVHRASASQRFNVDALVANVSHKAARIHFRADTYRIGDKSWEMRRITESRGVSLDRSRLETVAADTGRAFSWRRLALGLVGQEPRNVRHALVGRDAVWKSETGSAATLPVSWDARVDGQPLRDGITVGPHEKRLVSIGLTVPAAAQPGDRLTVNINAFDDAERAQGGVTLDIVVI
jgi:hypothetical protein